MTSYIKMNNETNSVENSQNSSLDKQFTYLNSDDEYDYYINNGLHYSYHKQTGVMSLMNNGTWVQFYQPEYIYLNDPNSILISYNNPYTQDLIMQLALSQHSNNILQSELNKLHLFNHQLTDQLNLANQALFNNSKSYSDDLSNKYNEVMERNSKLLTVIQDVNNKNFRINEENKSLKKKTSLQKTIIDSLENNEELLKNHFNDKIKIYLDRIKVLEESISKNDNNSVINNLQQQNRDLEERLLDLETKNTLYLRDLNNMNSKFQDLEEELSSFKNKENEYRNNLLKMNDKDNRIKSLENDIILLNQKLSLETNKNKLLTRDLENNNQKFKDLKNKLDESNIISESLYNNLNEIQHENELLKEIKERVMNNMKSTIFEYEGRINNLKEKHTKTLEKIKVGFQEIINNKNDEMKYLYNSLQNNLHRSMIIAKDISQFVPEEFLRDKSEDYRSFVNGTLPLKI